MQPSSLKRKKVRKSSHGWKNSLQGLSEDSLKLEGTIWDQLIKSVEIKRGCFYLMLELTGKSCFVRKHENQSLSLFEINV